MLVALGRAGEWATPQRIGVYAMLVGTAGPERLDALVRTTLGPVLDYDAARGSELLHTLDVYLAERGQLARASERLFIHVNTLRQRLDRIGQLLGPSWREPDEALQVQLALQLRRIAETGRHDRGGR